MQSTSNKNLSSCSGIETHFCSKLGETKIENCRFFDDLLAVFDDEEEFRTLIRRCIFLIDYKLFYYFSTPLLDTIKKLYVNTMMRPV